MVVAPLRGYGPRVFISYSFADAAIARQIESTLTAKGFQVRREDDTSLFNQKLSEAIPRRIADAEVFIQLLTTSANHSMWVGRELDWMFEQRKAGTGIIFLPIVFDKSTLPESLKEWWFLDLAGGNLTDEAMSAIERLCLKCVHLLRLAEDDPFTVVGSDLQAALAELPHDGRRVLLDSDGSLIRWSQDTIAFAEHLDSPHREGFLTQENDNFDRLVRRLKVRDEVTRKLILEVMLAMKAYTNEPLKDAQPPMRHFLQIILADLVVRAADVAPTETHPLRTALKDRIQAARAAHTESHSRGFLNPGLYAWVFGEQEGKDALCEMDMVAPDFRSITLQIPRRVFGDMADIYTRSALAFDPRSELLSGTFINYVLPQIAVHAAYNLVDPVTARADLEQEYAWRLEQYTKMGLH